MFFFGEFRTIIQSYKRSSVVCNKAWIAFKEITELSANISFQHSIYSWDLKGWWTCIIYLFLFDLRICKYSIMMVNKNGDTCSRGSNAWVKRKHVIEWLTITHQVVSHYLVHQSAKWHALRYEKQAMSFYELSSYLLWCKLKVYLVYSKLLWLFDVLLG